MHALLSQSGGAQLFSRPRVECSSVQTSVIIGPALGGLLYTINPTIAYGSAGLLFFAATFFMALIGTVRTKEVGAPLGESTPSLPDLPYQSSPPILGAISLRPLCSAPGRCDRAAPSKTGGAGCGAPGAWGFSRCAPAAGALIMSIFLTRNPHPAEGGENHVRSGHRLRCCHHGFCRLPGRSSFLSLFSRSSVHRT